MCWTWSPSIWAAFAGGSGRSLSPRPEKPAHGRCESATRRDRLNTRKKALTAESSARWANAVIFGNDAQYRVARDAQHRHIIGLQAAITTIEKRLAQPTADTLTPDERRECRKAKLPKGYATQAEKFAKQRRLQCLRAELGRVHSDRMFIGCVWSRAVNGGQKPPQPFRRERDLARVAREVGMRPLPNRGHRLGDEPFGNLTITVTPEGEVSLRLPKPLEHLSNAPHSRYKLSGTAVFSYRATMAVAHHRWKVRVLQHHSHRGRAGRYFTASSATTPEALVSATELGH